MASVESVTTYVSRSLRSFASPHALARVPAPDSAGIPSVLQQMGVDGPRLGIGLLNPGGGSQRVMVRSDQAEAARALLGEAAVPSEPEDWIDDGSSPYAKRRDGSPATTA